MKVLLTGSSGMLGSQIKLYCKQAGWKCTELNRSDFALSDMDSNVKKLDGHDVIIHAAANTNVEFCEQEYETAYRDNTLLTERLALAASKVGSKFVYISSTGVYGNYQCERPYHEYDLVIPTTHHHKSKWLGEKAVENLLNDYLIIRTGWIFGGEPENKKNFVARRIEEALSSDGVLYSNSQQRGCPTFSKDLTSFIFDLIVNNEVGVFNCTNEGYASRLEYVEEILKAASVDIEVRPASAESFKRKAPVSDNETSENLKLKQLDYSPMPHYQESLSKYIREELQDWLKALKERK